MSLSVRPGRPNPLVSIREMFQTIVPHLNNTYITRTGARTAHVLCWIVNTSLCSARLLALTSIVEIPLLLLLHFLMGGFRFPRLTSSYYALSFMTGARYFGATPVTH